MSKLIPFREIIKRLTLSTADLGYLKEYEDSTLVLNPHISSKKIGILYPIGSSLQERRIFDG